MSDIHFWRFYIYNSTKIFEMTRTSSLKGGASPLHKKQAVNCRNKNWRKSKCLFCTTISTHVRTSPNGHARNIHSVHRTLRGGHWDFRFYGFGNFRSVFRFCTKKAWFFGFGVFCGLSFILFCSRSPVFDKDQCLPLPSILFWVHDLITAERLNDRTMLHLFFFL